MEKQYNLCLEVLRRINKERQEAIRILNCLIAKGEEGVIKDLFDSMPKKWRTKVIKALDSYEEKNILDFLS